MVANRPTLNLREHCMSGLVDYVCSLRALVFLFAECLYSFSLVDLVQVSWFWSGGKDATVSTPHRFMSANLN